MLSAANGAQSAVRKILRKIGERMTKVLDAIMKGIGMLLRFMILAAAAIVLTQVFCRYALGKPLMWSEQTCRFMFIWMMLLGFPVMFHNKRFMSFELVLEMFPFRPRGIITVFIKLCVCAFCVFWFYGAVMLIVGTFTKYTTGVRIPYYCLYGAQNLSALLIFWVMGTQVVQDTVSLIKNWNKKEEIE